MEKEKELQLVSLAQAKKLKEMGFDWEVCYYYRWSPELFDKREGNFRLNRIFDYSDPLPTDYNNGDYDGENDIHYSAPSVALALKWFRDVKGCRYTIYSDTINIDNNSTEGIFYMYKTEGLMLDIEYETYEQCESALLDELLEYCEESADEK